MSFHLQAETLSHSCVVVFLIVGECILWKKLKLSEKEVEFHTEAVNCDDKSQVYISSSKKRVSATGLKDSRGV